MLQRSRGTLISLAMLLLLVTSLNSNASTICSYNCPDTGSGSGNPLPQISEIYSTDGSNLLLDTSGFIILDINLYNTLPNITISSLTPLYQGLSELPSFLTLPEILQLYKIGFTGNAEFTGLENDILLRQFDSTSTLNLTASNGVLIMDTQSLFVVPLPGAVWFLLSGLISIFSFGLKRKQTSH